MSLVGWLLLAHIGAGYVTLFVASVRAAAPQRPSRPERGAIV